jgi:hypothetical protein
VTTSEETVFDRIVDIAVAPAGDGAQKRPVVHIVLGSADGKQVRCPLTVKAALSLRAMLSRRLSILVADSAERRDE